MLERMLQKSGHFDEGFRASLFAECAVFGAVRGQKPVAQTWKNRASEFFLPECLRRRCNTFVAWAEGDAETAYREAILAKDAALKLDDNTHRRFLLEWSLVIEALENARTPKTGEMTPSEATASIPNT